MQEDGRLKRSEREKSAQVESSPASIIAGPNVLAFCLGLLRVEEEDLSALTGVYGSAGSHVYLCPVPPLHVVEAAFRRRVVTDPRYQRWVISPAPDGKRVVRLRQYRLKSWPGLSQVSGKKAQGDF